MEMHASHQAVDPARSPSKNQHETHVRCPKCHALNPQEATTKFCDQCGHRLRRKHRDKASSKHRSGRRKADQQQPTAENEKYQVPVTTSSDGGWFWGEHSQLPHQVSPHGTEEITSDIDNQILPEKPLKPRTQKAHTAHAAGKDRRSELARPLRRVQSFGENPSSLLPPIGNLPQQPPKESKLFVSPTAKDTGEAQASSSSKVDKPPSPRAHLWGQVLAEAIAEFESTNIILTAEIDSDERCISVLAQRLHIEEASRSKYVVASGISQLQFKDQELQKKVRMNKEKLAMVQQRLRTLYEQRKAEGTVDGEPELHAGPEEDVSAFIAAHEGNEPDGEAPDREAQEKPGQPSKKKTKRKKEGVATPSPGSTSSVEEQHRLVCAAVKIQKRFRVLRARRLFAAMVKRVYQRVYDADSKHYFYYNPRTKQSQWEVPQTLPKAQDIEKQLVRSRRRRAASSKSLNAAASRIQALYRRRAAQVALRQMLQQVYEKVYDPDSNSYYYYCKKTKTSSWEKPKLLRDSDIDEPNRTIDVSGSQQIITSPEADKRASAAVKIQLLYRNRATRIFFRDLVAGNIQKHFDEGVGAWYYYNDRTQESFWEQPRHASLQAAMPKPRS